MAIRAGKLTGSVAGDASSMPIERSKLSKELGDGIKETEPRRALRTKLALERILGKSLDQPFRTKWTDDGITREPFALAEFERLTNECVFTAGFIEHADLLAGVSPDGYLGNIGDVIDAKCFAWKEHIAVFQPDYKLDADIEAQLLHGMMVTGAKRGHAVFFNPEFPAELRTKIITLDTQEKDIKTALAIYEGRATLFLDDVDKTVAHLRGLGTVTA